MYCKNCGKQIADDSKFCKYCGTLVDDSMTTNDNSNEIKAEAEIVVSAQEDSSLKVEIKKKKPIMKKSTAANEIVANLKMLGIAFVLWLAYIIGFSIVHQKDIKQMDDNSYYGESCYDPSSLTDHWMEDWQRQYAIKVLMAPDYSKLKHPLKGLEAAAFAMDFIPLSSTDYASIISMNKESALNYANSIAKEKRLSKDLQESLKEKAIVDAQKDKEDFWSTINDYRQSGFKNDLIDNMIWAAIIALSLTILGRYIFKIITWVIKNKT